MDLKVGQTYYSISKFTKLKMRLLEVSEKIRFNKQCKRLGLIPKYARIKINNTTESAVRAKQIAEERWVANEIKRLHSQKDVTNYRLYKAHLELLNSVHPSMIISTLKKINQKIWPRIRKIRCSLKRKIRRLLRSKTTTAQNNDAFSSCHHVFFDRLYNHAKVDFSPTELDTLYKGLKFNLPHRKNNDLSKDLLLSESIIKSIPTQDIRNDARSSIKRSYKTFTSKTSNNHLATAFDTDRRNILSIRRKLLSNNALATKADKGNTIVVMHNNEYVCKVEQFLKDNDIKPLNEDPTLRFTRDINSAINRSNALLTSEISKRFLKPMKPRAPVLRGLPKIHKEQMPIRPVVDYTTAPAYRVAKKLESIIKAGIKLEKSFSLKNTYDFIDQTKNLDVPVSVRMSSLDIVNLYTNVPVEETIQIVERLLLRSKIYGVDKICDVVSLLRVVLEQNYFSFNGSIYHQKEGLAMGSPLSGLLADIYMNHFEVEHIMSNNIYKNQIIYYGRYVDDTFLLFKGTTRQLDSMVSQLNKVHPNIKFTSEHEVEGSIHFLDSTATRVGSRISYDIYRKPTTTSTTIHNSSFHPKSQKMAAFNSLVYRAIKFPLSDDARKREIDVIKHIAVANGYDNTIVDDILRKHTKKSALPRPPKEELKFIPSDFNNAFAIPISNFLRKHNMNVAFSTSNNMLRLLKPKSGTLVPLEDKAGVYRLKCGSCDGFYIGQTGRSFRVRFKEHQPKKPGSATSSSNFARHLSAEGHISGNFETSCTPLHICDKGPLMNTLEEYEIYKAHKLDPQNTLNDKLCFSNNALYDLCIREETRSSHK